MSLRSRLLPPFILVVVIALAVLGATPGSASAAPPAVDGGSHRASERTIFARTAYLCMGYRACRQAGMGNAGYAAVNDRMYWRMYSGHNCTNYAAYRMVRSGMPNERPWSGSGNATNWGTSVPKLTNGTPRVGAVAWWRANVGPAGSAGHVAFVERVVSDDEIVVSQDSWGGDFSWATVTRSSGNWPSGFIHFNDRPMLNKAKPVVTGVAKVGSVLTTTAGRWRPSDATVTYQWYADSRPIRNATSTSLRLGRGRVGQQITVKVIASKLGYPRKAATSTPTEAVLPGALENTSPPTISGTARVDSTLTLSGGSWSPAAQLRYWWRADGKRIRGATDSTLRLGPDLVGKAITARVIASRTGYDNVSVISAATAPVAPGRFRVTTPPSVHGQASLGETLTVDRGAYRPGRATVAVQWLRGGQPVLNATGPTYRISAADLGSRISARVTLSRTGYTTTALRTAPTAKLRSQPRIRARTDPGAHRLRVTVTVRAPGVREVTGEVAARMAGAVQRVTLRHGTATIRLRHLAAGRHTLKLRYFRTDTVERGVLSRSVRIG